jgi:hypothetical protein
VSLQEVVTPAAELDSSINSINLDGTITPTGRPAAPAPGSSKQPSQPAAAAPATPSVITTGDDLGSITLGQVLSVSGQVALQVLQVVVRVAAVAIKYALQAFICLVKLIAQLANGPS